MMIDGLEGAMRMHKIILGLAAILIVMGGPARGAVKTDPTLSLKIGNPKYKDKVLTVAPEILLAASKGKPIPFGRMIDAMASARLVCIGETHNSLPMHEVQAKVIEALYAKDNALAIGLEMLPAETQPVLDRWTRGLLTEDAFVREIAWYVNWNFNFGYYRRIFAFAKEHALPIYALNAPRDVITRIRMRGWDALSPDEKLLFPGPPDVGNAEHRSLIRAVFESSDLPPQMKGAGLDMVFEGLYRSQCAWDEVMAANALRGMERDGRRVVVLAGSGHLLYNLGINRRAFEKSRLPSMTLISLEVPGETKALTVARSLGDFLWGLPEEARPAFPDVGLSFKMFENLANPVVDAKPISGAAKGGDFEKGDIVLSVDGKSFPGINDLRIHLAGFDWGGEAKFRLFRAGQVKDVVLKFNPPAEGERP
jgi:uncharacterized iron-regulated protein